MEDCTQTNADPSRYNYCYNLNCLEKIIKEKIEIIYGNIWHLKFMVFF